MRPYKKQQQQQNIGNFYRPSYIIPTLSMNQLSLRFAHQVVENMDRINKRENAMLLLYFSDNYRNFKPFSFLDDDYCYYNNKRGDSFGQVFFEKYNKIIRFVNRHQQLQKFISVTTNDNNVTKSTYKKHHHRHHQLNKKESTVLTNFHVKNNNNKRKRITSIKNPNRNYHTSSSSDSCVEDDENDYIQVQKKRKYNK